MACLKWQEEKEERKQRALANHDRLHALYVHDRLAFERERKKAIDALINSAGDERLREALRRQQKTWDQRMKNAGSSHNRFVLAQSFFWEHFFETWLPAMQRFSKTLNSERE